MAQIEAALLPVSNSSFDVRQVWHGPFCEIFALILVQSGSAEIFLGKVLCEHQDVLYVVHKVPAGSVMQLLCGHQ